jgi:hypothetical protein
VLDTCIAVNLTIAARDLFAVPLLDGGVLVIHEPALSDLGLRDAFAEITVKDSFRLVGKEYLA